MKGYQRTDVHPRHTRAGEPEVCRFCLNPTERDEIGQNTCCDMSVDEDIRSFENRLAESIGRGDFNLKRL